MILGMEMQFGMNANKDRGIQPPGSPGQERFLVTFWPKALRLFIRVLFSGLFQVSSLHCLTLSNRVDHFCIFRCF